MVGKNKKALGSKPKAFITQFNITKFHNDCKEAREIAISYFIKFFITSNPVKVFRKFKTINDLLQDAKLHGIKGNYRSYNYYSRELSKFILSSFEYEQAIKELASILRV